MAKGDWNASSDLIRCVPFIESIAMVVQSALAEAMLVRGL